MKPTPNSDVSRSELSDAQQPTQQAGRNPTQMSPEQFAESLRQQTETFLQDVIKTVNEAPDGEWIEGSEEGVRDLSADFRRNVFEAAVQGRVDAAEAAFSPSADDCDRPRHATTGDQKHAQQRSTENQRADD